MEIILLVSSWLAGLILGESGSINLVWLGAFAALAVVGILLSGWSRTWRLAFCCALSLSLGAGRVILSQPHFDAGSLATYNDIGPVTVRAIVIQRPGSLGTQQRLHLRAHQLSYQDQDIEVSGDLLSRLPAYPRFRYGDELELTGKLLTPPRLASFDYRQVLAHKGIHSIMEMPKAQLVSRDNAPLATRYLYAFKDHLVTIVAEIMPMPEAGLLSGILIGDESGIPKWLQESFRQTGTSHIVVISGWNVAMLAGIVLALSGPLLGKRKSLIAAACTVCGYTILVGFDPPVVRAAIMGLLSLLAVLSGRQALALYTLFLAAFLMTVFRPYTLWDLGFQLSFAATLGLIIFQPVLKRCSTHLLSRVGLGGRLWLPRSIGELLLVTLSAQILVLPILLYRLGEVSLITLPANILILPVQAPSLGLGALATIAGLIWLPLGRIVGWFAWPFLSYSTRMVEWMSTLPAASASVPRPHLGLVLLYYVLALLLAIALNRDTNTLRQLWVRFRSAMPSKVAPMALALGVVLSWTAAWMQPDGRLHIYILDVGQGDAILVSSPGGSQILIDGGPDGPTLLAALGRRMPLWDRNLDVVVLSHADADHISGLLAALMRYRVGVAISHRLEEGTLMETEWSEHVRGAQATLHLAEPGMTLSLSDGLHMEILHPPTDLPFSLSANDRSVVLRLTYGHFGMLLTGDLETEGERLLLIRDVLLASNVLKVSHHGASSGTSEALLEAVAPAAAVISAGVGNRFGHPSAAVLHRLEDRGIPIWRTDYHGTVELITDGKQLWIKSQYAR